MRTRRYRGLVAAMLLAASAAALAGPAAARPTADGGGLGGEWAAGRSHPVEDPYYPAKSNPEVDALHYDLDLTWDGTTLAGNVTVDFRAALTTDTVRLDLIHSLKVSSVDLDGAATAFHHRGAGLVIDVGQVIKGSHHTLTITYAGSPHTVPAPTHRGDFAEGLGWTADSDGNIYTFQEPYGAFTWFPVNDHPSDKAFYDAEITVPAGDSAVFNGTLVGQSPAPRDETTFDWHLDSQVASYLTTIAIGPYTAYSDTMPDGTPATYWLLPRDASELTTLRSQVQDAFGWLTDNAGSYPFSSFGVVVVGGDSAMETQTLVTTSRQALDRPDAVIEHEMAHEWYGDAISPTTWQGLWLNEGWAMWMQQAYEVYRGGYQYLGGIENWRPYDEASRRKSGPPGDYDPKSFGDLNVYLGPAMMLDRIRLQIGDAAFTQLSKDWVSEHEFGNVDRAEFTRWVNAETGQRFTKLINLWLDSRHTPA